MTDANYLKSVIIRFDGSQNVLANAMGISLSALNAKINGWLGREFTRKEIDFIANRYKLSNDEICAIFFAR